MKTKYILFPIFLIIFSINLFSQNVIKPYKGYSTEVGNLVSMLEDLKGRVTKSVENLNQNETDFLLDDNANRIGALILHLAATKKYYQLFTFENRGFNNDELSKWETPLNLGDKARTEIVDKPIKYYLDIWNDVRKETLKLLKQKDDKWLNSKVDIKNVSMNNHWAWYHVMEHQANHMGQIRMIASRIK